MGKRVNWIDVAKGICILAVIIGHFGHAEINTVVFSFHLTVFFVLSGYTMKPKPLDGAYLTNMFKRLMIPYFVTCGCVLVMNVFNAVYINHLMATEELTATVYKVLQHTFAASGGPTQLMGVELGGRIGAIWFLPGLFFSKVVSEWVLMRFHRWRYRVGLSILLGALAILSARFVWLPFSLQPALMAVPFVLLGRYLREYEVIDRLKWWHYAGSLLLWLVIYGYGMLTENEGVVDISFSAASVPDYLLTPLAAITSSLVVVGLSILLQRFKPLVWLGKNSLTVLCVHLFLLNCCGYYLNKYVSPHMPWDMTPKTTPRTLTFFAIHVVVCVLVTLVLNWLTSLQKPKNDLTAFEGQERSVEVLRTLLIVLMLVGYVSVCGEFRLLIYSVYMAAFLVMSGYFYRSIDAVCAETGKCRLPVYGKQLGQAAKELLLPYAVFVVLYGLFSPTQPNLRNILLGVNFSESSLSGATGGEAIYLLLLLFGVRFLYSTADLLLRRPLPMAIGIMLLSLLGLWLGKEGRFLPWGFDCALYALVFFAIGCVLRWFDMLTITAKNPWLYFLTVPVWAYMMHRGGTDLVARQYEPYGLVILGSVCGFLTLYGGCALLSQSMPRWIEKIIRLTSKSTWYVFILYTVFDSRISAWIYTYLHFEKHNLSHLVIRIVVLLAGGMLVSLCVSGLSHLLHRIELSKKTVK